MGQIVCFGEMLLRLSSPGKQRLFQTQMLETNFVGAEANAGVTLARLGNQVDMVTVVPDNPVGRACEDALHHQGVNTRYVLRQGERLSTYYLETGALIRPSSITYDRANSAFVNASPADYDWKTILGGADILHICGITLAVGESAYAASLEAVKTARDLGVRVSFDCNYRASLWKGREDRAVEQIRQVISHANILFGGRRDAKLLIGAEIGSGDPQATFRQAANAFFASFPSLEYVCSTQRVVRSADSNDLTGFITTPEQFATSNTYVLDGIVDRIGGGDAFAGGVLHKLCAQASLEDTISFGTAASAIKHSIPGDFNLTSEAEVTALAQGGTLDVQR